MLIPINNETDISDQINKFYIIYCEKGSIKIVQNPSLRIKKYDEHDLINRVLIIKNWKEEKDLATHKKMLRKKLSELVEEFKMKLTDDELLKILASGGIFNNIKYGTGIEDVGKKVKKAYNVK